MTSKSRLFRDERQFRLFWKSVVVLGKWQGVVIVMDFVILTCLVVLTFCHNVLSYWAFGEVSKNIRRVLNSLDFSLTLKMTKVNFWFDLRLVSWWKCLRVFAVAMPCKLLGRFVLRSTLAVIMWIFALCENSKWQNTPSLQVDISPFTKAQNDNAGFCFVLATHFVAVTPCFCKG